MSSGKYEASRFSVLFQCVLVYLLFLFNVSLLQSLAKLLFDSLCFNWLLLILLDLWWFSFMVLYFLFFLLHEEPEDYDYHNNDDKYDENTTKTRASGGSLEWVGNFTINNSFGKV